MHRHQYKGRKLSLKADQRRSLLRGLIDSLILYEEIETTFPRAKEVASIFDKLVSKAKKSDLPKKREVFSFGLSKAASQKLIYELVSSFQNRNSGYCQIIKTGNRKGDNAPLVKISLILDQKVEKNSQPVGKQKKSTIQKNKPVVNRR